MRARAAQVKSLEWRAILRPANQRTKSEKLIECLFAVVNVSTAQTIRLFEIDRRDHLRSYDHFADARRVSFEFVDDVVRKLLAARGPISFLHLYGANCT